MTIGIVGGVYGNYFGVPLSYITFMRDWLECRDYRILLPYSPIYKDLDLLILPGGADVNPARYGEAPDFYTDKPDIIKEYFDTHVLPRYINNGTPIFGICRGLQTLAVHFGAKLTQDMYHETNTSESPSSGIHNILVKETGKKIKVNSRHHQAIYAPSVKDTPIDVLAVHPSFQHHIEAIRVQGYKIAAVQYHPEDLDDNSGVEYAVGLINSIRK